MTLYQAAETVFVAMALVTLVIPVCLLVLWKFLAFWRAHGPRVAWLAGGIGIAAALVVLFAIRGLWMPYAVRFPTWARVLGWVVSVSAGIIVWVAQETITLRVRAFLPVLRPAERFELKTGGIYAMVRHPIYAAFALFDLGVFLVSGYYLVLGAMIVFLAALPWACRQEERVLIERFGEAYLRYRASVPMLLPRLIPARKR